MLLLHLLLVLAAGKGNLGVCHQRKHPCCCCCCCCCLFLPPAAFAAAVVAALLPCLLGGPAALVAAPHVPTTPMFLFERNIVLRNTVVSPALFSSKRHCIENTQGLACLLKSKQRKEGIEDKRSAACRPVHSLARQRDRRRAAARPLCGVRAVTRVLAAGRTTKRERPFI